MINGTPDKVNFASEIAVNDLVEQIRRSITSPITDQHEREAQRWFVESFFDCQFCLRRHEVCRAAEKVFGLSHRRSRALHDLSLLEARRVVFAETRHSPPSVAQLGRSKDAGLVRYLNFCTPPEFAKLTILLHGLPAAIIIQIRPSNENRIKADHWEAIRQNVELVLNGDPSATQLFEN